MDQALLPSGIHWADALVGLYSEGASDVEVCKELKLPWKEFEKRCRDDSLFNELVTFGRLSSKAWWIALGRKAAKTGAASQAFQFWYANMKNQFGWTDKSETVLDDRKASSLSTDEIQARMSALKDKILKRPSNVEMNEILGEKLAL